MRLLIPWLFLLLSFYSLVSSWTFPVGSPRRFLWSQQQRRRTVCIVQDGTTTPNTSSTLDGDKDGQYIQVVDSHFMKLALEEAQKAKDRGEVPIGALVVRPLPSSESESSSSLENTTSTDTTRRTFFEVLGSDSNRVEQRQDASAHAELLAMRQAAHNNHIINDKDNNKATQDGNWRLLNTTLYTTLEPCAMCLAAAQAFRVHRIVYGAPDLRIGAIDTYLQLLEVPHPTHTINHVVRGVHQEECADLMRSFFRERRRKQPPKNLQPKGAASSWRTRTMSWWRRVRGN